MSEASAPVEVSPIRLDKRKEIWDKAHKEITPIKDQLGKTLEDRKKWSEDQNRRDQNITEDALRIRKTASESKEIPDYNPVHYYQRVNENILGPLEERWQKIKSGVYPNEDKRADLGLFTEDILNPDLENTTTKRQAAHNLRRFFEETDLLRIAVEGRHGIPFLQMISEEIQGINQDFRLVTSRLGKNPQVELMRRALFNLEETIDEWKISTRREAENLIGRQDEAPPYPKILLDNYVSELNSFDRMPG